MPSSCHNHRWLLAELDGILSGIAADGVIRIEELRYLEYWLHLSQDVIELFPYSFLARLAADVLRDEVVTTAESEEMLAMIRAWSRSWPEEAGLRETVTTESEAL